MALILENSKCPFCGQLLSEGGETNALPALFPEGHKYSICSDAGFHISCFENWEHCDAVKEKYEKYQQLLSEKPSIPEGMSFEEFEKSAAYLEFTNRVEQLLNNV